MTTCTHAAVGVLLVALAGTRPASAPAQAPEQPRPPGTLAHEVGPTHPSAAPEQRRVSPPLPPEALRRGPYQSVQVNVDEFGNNIVGDAANEPSIAWYWGNPAVAAIGWRQFDSIYSDFRQAGVGYSHDAGRTWTFVATLAPGESRSDPVLDADAHGNLYFYSLYFTGTGFYRERMFKSTDRGVTWNALIDAFGGDKPWMVIDRTGGIGDGNIYAFWQPFASCCGDRTFTRSVDGGRTFMEPIHIPANPMFGTLAVGPDGEVYAAGIEGVNYADYGQFVVAKSIDAQDPAVEPTFVTTDVDLGGALVYGGSPNPIGLLGQAWVAVDCSDGPTRGYVYLLCSVDPPGSDPLDVRIARSTDGGQTWSASRRINDDPAGTNAWQWFGTLSVAPNGRLDVIWNDTRNTGQARLCELYYSYSTDGGLTWSPNVPVSPVFDSYLGWPMNSKLGDYYHAVSDNAGVNVAYAATFNGEQDVYFLRIGMRDCNANGVEDAQDVGGGTSADCNANLVPDECELDCNANGVPDDCDSDPTDPDSNGQVSLDCNENQVPDECEPDGTEDCNANGVPDLCDVYAGTSPDCNGNGVPDECDLSGGHSPDCNANGTPDECEPDCNASGVPDDCDTDPTDPDHDGFVSPDCNANAYPDECEIEGPRDCNGNGVPDECDLAQGTSADCQANGVPDECEATAAADNCAAARSVCTGRTYYGSTALATPDGNASCADTAGTPDVWYRYRSLGGGQLAISLCGSTYDTVLSVHNGCPGTVGNQVACNNDWCGKQSRLTMVVSPGRDYWIRVSGAGGATGGFQLVLTGPPCAQDGDCNANGVPDECERDCNGNGQPDDCDIASGYSADLDHNGIPDECGLPGDVNCDGQVDLFDVAPFVVALVDPAGYAAQFPDCYAANGDINGDGVVDGFDIGPFVELLTGG